jgi:hypothetical protein
LLCPHKTERHAHAGGYVTLYLHVNLHESSGACISGS